MGLLWIDGFEGYGSSVGGAPAPTGIIGRRYPTISGESGMDIETGRYGDYCLEIIDYLAYLQTPHLTTDATLVWGAAVKMTGFAVTPRQLVDFFALTQLGMNLRTQSDGTLTMYLNTTPLATSLAQLATGIWQYLEVKIVTHDSAGSYEVRLNGVDILSDSGLDTQADGTAYHTGVRLRTGFGITTQWDDMYILDGTGSANNDFLGNRQVCPLRPDGDGSTNDWTPLSGNNSENVDEVQLDEDTSYNETNTLNDVDYYDYAAASGLTTIDGVQITSEVKVTAGSMDFVTLIKSDAAEVESNPETITSTSYITKTHLIEEDPNTNTAWTQTGLNAAEFGVRAE